MAGSLAGQKELKTREQFTKALLDSGSRLSVVNFYASWCSPCKTIVPTWERYQSLFPDVKFFTANVDDNENAEYYNVSAVPTFILFKNGVKLERMTGADMEALKTLILKCTS